MTSKLRVVDPIDVVEYPQFLGGSYSGSKALLRRPKRGPKAETEWTRQLMANHAAWHDVVGLLPIASFEVERQKRPKLELHDARLSAGRSMLLGLPKVDAVARLVDGSSCLVEAKLDSSTVEMLRGVAQLLYYKTLLMSLEGANVSGLVLASPAWPAYVIDVIDEYRLPVRLLKVTEDEVFGSVPVHLLGGTQ